MQVGAQVWNDVPKMETKTGGDYVIWPVIWQTLTSKGLRSVSPDEVPASLTLISGTRENYHQYSF